MKRILSIVLVLLFAASLTGTAFASTGVRITRVRIFAPSTTVRVGRTLQLEERVSPSNATYDRAEWFSSDWDIADVDEWGEVTGYRAGEVTITVRVFDEAGRRHSGSIDITVTGGTGGNSSSGSSGSGQLDRDPEETRPPAASTPPAVNTGGRISAATVTNAVRSNAVRGQTTNAIFRGYSSVAAGTLKSANTEMQRLGGTVLLNFDTMNAANPKAVEGRVTINPRNSTNLTQDMQLGVFTNDGATGRTRRTFERFFSNRVVIIKASQKGSYGMSVNYAVKIGTDLANSRQLKLYSYDPGTNRYQEIRNSNIWLDRNGFVHFTTHLGDDLVISDGALRRR